MVREKKGKKYNIEELHQLIDSASLPSQRKTSPEKKTPQPQHKRYPDEAIETKDISSVIDVRERKSPDLTPRVVVHTREPVPKKEDRIIKIELAPKPEKRHRDVQPISRTLPPDDPFAKEALYEIERVTSDEEYLTQERSDEFTPVVSVQGPKNHLPEWEPVTKDNEGREPAAQSEVKNIEASPPEFEPIKENAAPLPPPPETEHRTVPSEPGVSSEQTAKIPSLNRWEVRKKEREEKKLRKQAEKQARRESKERERESVRLAAEQNKKLQFEQRDSQKRQREEQRLQEEARRKAAIEAIQSVKEKEKKQRLNQIEQQKKQRDELRTKKLEANKAAKEAAEKEREARLLAKEHDRKVQSEKKEIEKRNKEEQRLKAIEAKRAAIEAKEKNRKELLILKEQQQKLRMEKINLKKKEKEEKKLKKLQEEVQRKPTDVPAQLPSTQKKTGPRDAAGAEPMEPPKKHFHFFKEKEENAIPSETPKGDISSEGTEPSAELEELQARDVTDFPFTEREEKQEPSRKEQKEKDRQERVEQKRKEKEEWSRKRLEMKEWDEHAKQERRDKEEYKRKKMEEKKAAQETKEKERETQRQTKETQKQKQFMLALKEHEQRMNEKGEQKQKKFDRKMEKERTSRFVLGRAAKHKATDEEDETKEQPVEAWAEKDTPSDSKRFALNKAKEQRRLKAVERRMQKEEEKKKKDHEKMKRMEEKKARKRSDIYFGEKLLNEKLAGGGEERSDVFYGFDSINQETSDLLIKNGYTSVDKLQNATVKDFIKIGIKKKIGQKILAEIGEFVEWEVMDADKHSKENT